MWLRQSLHLLLNLQKLTALKLTSQWQMRRTCSVGLIYLPNQLVIRQLLKAIGIHTP